MKTFINFIESLAVQQATRMGLKSDGHGGWYDNKGEFVACLLYTSPSPRD